ncbi:MAG: MarR family transcriptional regulator [Burkholderiaceae bacterium]
MADRREDSPAVRPEAQVADAAASPDGARGGAHDPLSHLVGYAALRVHLVLRECFEQEIGGPLDLRPVEFTLLSRLASHGALTAKALAEVLAVRAPNLTPVLERLSERGLIQRERNRDDRRSVLIRLSPAGRRLQKRAMEVSHTMEREALGGLAPAERERFLQLAWRIVAPV